MKKLSLSSLLSLSLLLSSFLSLLLLTAGCNRSQEGTKIDVVINDQTIAAGKQLYVSNCAMCHGESGDGNGAASKMLNPKPRNHTDKKYMETLSNERLFSIIRNGGVVVGMPTMPASPRLNDEEIKNMIAFIRSIEK
jgi:mono/diheme cytochrome c family protein